MVLPEVVHAAEVLASAWAGSPPADAAGRARCRQLTALLRRHDPALAAEADRGVTDAARLRQALADAARQDPAVRTLVGQLAPASAPPSRASAPTPEATLEAITRFLEPAPPAPRPRVLFLAANPVDTLPLRLGQEQREIRAVLALTGNRYALEPVTAVRPEDLTLALSQLRPRIVHFSGHGTANGALCLENGLGKMHPVSPDALASLFGVLEGETECVVLNACYSRVQAEEIARHVKYVVGMVGQVGDRAALAFAKGFYQGLGEGRPVPQAFGMGHSLVKLENLPHRLAPVLMQDGAAVP